jgi:hypothetical protein
VDISYLLPNELIQAVGAVRASSVDARRMPIASRQKAGSHRQGQHAVQNGLRNGSAWVLRWQVHMSVAADPAGRATNRLEGYMTRQSAILPDQAT